VQSGNRRGRSSNPNSPSERVVFFFRGTRKGILLARDRATQRKRLVGLCPRKRDSGYLHHSIYLLAVPSLLL